MRWSIRGCLARVFSIVALNVAATLRAAAVPAVTIPYIRAFSPAGDGPIVYLGSDQGLYRSAGAPYTAWDHQNALFWQYLTRGVVAPGGWLRHTGLPLTETIPGTVTEGALGRRRIMLQAFANAILTYDPQNPAPYRVERANAGSDDAVVFPGMVR